MNECGPLRQRVVPPHVRDLVRQDGGKFVRVPSAPIGGEKNYGLANAQHQRRRNDVRLSERGFAAQPSRARGSRKRA